MPRRNGHFFFFRMDVLASFIGAFGVAQPVGLP
jgi:hypothetical protein